MCSVPPMGRVESADERIKFRLWEDQSPAMGRGELVLKSGARYQSSESSRNQWSKTTFQVSTQYPVVDKYFLYLSQMKLNMSSQVYVSLFKVILGRGAPHGDFLISNTSRCAVYSLLSWSFPCPKELLFSCTHLESDMTRRAKGPKCGRRQGGKAPDKKKFPLLG